MEQKIYAMGNVEQLCRRAAELIIAAGRQAVQKRGRFTLVLTGGRTVQALYKYLVAISAEAGLQGLIGKTDFFLGDERWVPADHPDSNGGMVQRLLLDPLEIAATHRFLMEVGQAAPAKDAAEYEKILRRYFAGQSSGDGWIPEFDLVLLGMGSDGHVASLFPGTEAWQERNSWVTTSFPPRLAPAVERLTMTMPILERAREVILLATGEEKQQIVKKIMVDPLAAAELMPAGFIKSSGRKIWLLADNLIE